MNERDNNVLEELFRHSSWRNGAVCDHCGNRREPGEDTCECGEPRTPWGNILNEMMKPKNRVPEVPKAPEGCLACGTKKIPGEPACVESVSYTHLTLPTIYSV